ncbi:MAG: magnesium and cobalt transport protein CorA [Gammaproteobacteria bacterium RIFCSPHIGHO2_12_FULL_40_19]|nr:MAG: magnesium and cobalt transport protein CorA [Gammaproteobacteria bacterium RIFCSPHIGHO2_12_FULL_40_19]
MFSDLQHRVKKAGQPPGTAVYTGNQKVKPSVLTVATFDTNDCKVSTGNQIDPLLTDQKSTEITWINVEGLSDVEQIKNLTARFHIHPLTVEDILNVEQRPKVEEFDNYLFVTLKILNWKNKALFFSVKQVSIIIGSNFILTFLEPGSTIFAPILDRLQGSGTQRLRQQKTDYLAYRMIDAIVDQYFVVLEGLGEQIEIVEDRIVTEPTPQNARTIYRLKRQILILRKAIWPMREAVNHLQYAEETLITPFTRVYLRDVYDHTMQAIDTIETFRDMLSSMLDMYLSGLTIRMNEIMKTLTIITTIFIPITALASIYGMNLPDIPLMKSHWGFSIVAGIMVACVACMVVYFRKKKWI